MKINELKVGDTIKYSTDKPTNKTYQAEITEVWPDKLRVKQMESYSYFIRNSQVVSKIEAVTEYREVEIKQPAAPVEFIFHPNKTSQSFGYNPEPLYDRGIIMNMSYSKCWASTKVEGVDSEGNYMYLECPKALEINPCRKYKISIAEID